MVEPQPAVGRNIRARNSNHSKSLVTYFWNHLLLVGVIAAFAGSYILFEQSEVRICIQLEEGSGC